MPEIKITYIEDPSKVEEIKKWNRMKKFLVFVHWMTIAGWIWFLKMTSDISPWFAIIYMALTVPRYLFLEPKLLYIHLGFMIFTFAIFLTTTFIIIIHFFVDISFPQSYASTSEFKFLDRWSFELSIFYTISTTFLIPYILGTYYYVKTKLRAEIPENRVEMVKY